ncbi:40S ribosomal S2, partial [Paramuricea clavata]
ESEPILDCNVEIATATLENEESNQQGNQIRQNEIDNSNVYPLLDDRSLHDDLQNLPVTRVLKIRRVNIMQDMIENFKEKSIMQIHVKVVMINSFGKEELGVDDGGVFRDALSAFWSSFYDSCMVGEEERVPVVRHDFKEEEWEAIALILVKG